MYVILTSKPGQFRTEIGPGLQAVEHWDYRFGDQRKALFVIAELHDPQVRVRVVDEAGPEVVNRVPSKFLERYPSVAAARHELEHLCRFGQQCAELRPLALPEGA